MKVPTCVHHFSPIEKGFSYVCGLVRQKWALEQTIGAKRTLEASFEYYSYRGPGGSQAKSNFKILENNHHNYWLKNRDIKLP